MSIAQALRILDPSTSLTDLQPIRYRPPEHLPGAALTRAVLAALRRAQPALPQKYRRMQAIIPTFMSL
ncbi:hypothetical protein [Noviherbaspirillum malthae]|uniref:hypothetical protein n=1 Tax=Noviherbaspirillum malthae TaxID=1260987 RepID=UPI00188E97F3|nr:hypothetical protein [Noviherbaspirillum malthae]